MNGRTSSRSRASRASKSTGPSGSPNGTRAAISDGVARRSAGRSVSVSISTIRSTVLCPIARMAAGSSASGFMSAGSRPPDPRATGPCPALCAPAKSRVPPRRAAPPGSRTFPPHPATRRFVMLSKTFGLAALTAVALAATGCGGDDGAGGDAKAAPAAKSPGLTAELPAKIKSKGTLTGALDATYPPNEFVAKDGRTLTGMSADLANAVGKALGVRVNLVNASFDSILPGLAAGKYDIGLSSFTVTKEREQVVDFVTYYSAGTSFFARAGKGAGIASLGDLCGHTTAMQKGTIQADDATAQAKKCRSQGKPELKTLILPDQNAANLAISSGRAGVGMADSPVAAYAVKKSGGRFDVVGEPYGTAPYGVAIPKRSGMTKPILHAVEAIMGNGRYASVLRKWGLEVGAIDKPVVNGAVE